LSGFERWTDETRHALAAAYDGALEALAIKALDAGMIPDAVNWSRRLVAADALNSRIVLLLMRALELAGDRAGAIRAAELHASVLKHDIDVDLPDEILREVQRPEASSYAVEAQTSPADGRSSDRARPCGPNRSWRQRPAIGQSSRSLLPARPRRWAAIGIAGALLISVSTLAAFTIANRTKATRRRWCSRSLHLARVQGDSAYSTTERARGRTLAQEIVQRIVRRSSTCSTTPAAPGGGPTSTSERSCKWRAAPERIGAQQ
jgi:hypothetical protein